MLNNKNTKICCELSSRDKIDKQNVFVLIATSPYRLMDLCFLAWIISVMSLTVVYWLMSISILNEKQRF